jgi:sugar phosphate isomerase/epimerase
MNLQSLPRFFVLLLLAVAPSAIGFDGATGIQLYSLRADLDKDLEGTLDRVKAWGIPYVESYSLHRRTPEQLKSLIEARGLKLISGHFPFERLTKKIGECVAEAKALGLQYVICPWLPHEEANFTEAAARKAAADMNEIGKAFKEAGIVFGYHPHGFELVPRPQGEGTMLDILISETNPEFVAFQMDVFWIVHPGGDPVAYLEKYPGRWLLMHLKDIRKGARTGVYTGKANKDDSVALGTGMVDWPKVLEAAKKAGVRYYLIEDESGAVNVQVPQSLSYLKGL